MRAPIVTTIVRTCIVLAVASSLALSAVVVNGQSTSTKPAADKSAWKVTPLERPKQWAGRTTISNAELANLKNTLQQLMDGGDAFFADELILAALDGKPKFSSADTQVGNYDQSWLSERIIDNRTSLVIDPPDGRIPPLIPAAVERARATAAAAKARGPADRAQDLSLGTRCVSAGTPNIRAGYQSYFDITQGPNVVALRTEMIHDTRIFPIGAGPHVSPVIKQYHGDSRAHWDGDTLVVDTTNYVHNSTRVGATTTDRLRTTEKFTRVADDTIEYAITFDDPTVWTRPWTMMIPLKQTGERMFEFACHEGNYGLRAILSGARAQEVGP
jgi:hypothetical protein